MRVLGFAAAVIAALLVLDNTVGLTAAHNVAGSLVTAGSHALAGVGQWLQSAAKAG